VSTGSSTSQSPVACALTAAELRERRHDVLELLRRHGRDRRPLPNGYRLCFEPAADLMVSLAALIETERACCPFLSFQLIVEPDHGPVSLELTGPAGTREFLEAELGLGPAS